MMNGPGRALFSVLVVLCLVPALCGTARAGFKSEFDLEAGYAANTGDSLNAALGERNYWDQNLRLRLMWSGMLASGWSLDAAYLVKAYYGGGAVLTRRLHDAEPDFYVDPEKTALVRLGGTAVDQGRIDVTQRLDRLVLGYSSAHLVVRVGRQALTWGGGLVFHPMDLFNPFPPNATYTTYKPGVDMLYGQWLFDSGADLQAVAVVRRNPDSGCVAGDQSSFGVKWHGFLGPSQQLGMDVLLARDYASQVLGIAASGPAGGATWTAEIVPTLLDGGTVRTSLLGNVQYAWVWGGKNVNGYLEYFRNGFGVTASSVTLAGLPASLRERLARGELFTVSKDYLAVGVDVQWSPLFTLKPSVLCNLDDRSALLLAQAIYSLSQNTSLTAGGQLGLGSRGTEYGGLETAPDSGIYATPANLVYTRFTWYY